MLIIAAVTKQRRGEEGEDINLEKGLILVGFFPLPAAEYSQCLVSVSRIIWNAYTCHLLSNHN